MSCAVKQMANTALPWQELMTRFVTKVMSISYIRYQVSFKETEKQ